MNKRIPHDIQRVVYTVPEIAGMLGLNLIKTYSLMRTPGFPAIRVSRRIIVPKKAFDAWLERTAFDTKSSGTEGRQ